MTESVTWLSVFKQGLQQQAQSVLMWGLSPGFQCITWACSSGITEGVTQHQDFLHPDLLYFITGEKLPIKTVTAPNMA